MSAAILIDLARITREFVELLETGSCASSGDPVATKAIAELHATVNRALLEYRGTRKQLWASNSYPFDRHWTAALEDEADEVSPSSIDNLQNLSASRADATPSKTTNAGPPEEEDEFYAGQIGND